MTYDQIKSILDSLNRDVARLVAVVRERDAEIAKLKADVTGEGFKELVKYMTTQHGVRGYQSPDAARREVAKRYNHDLGVKDANISAVAHNRALLDKSVAFLTALGLRQEVVVRKPRSNWKTERKTANWLSELRCEAETTDSWPRVESDYAEHMKAIGEWEAELSKEKEQAAAVEAREMAALDKRIQVGVIATKYGMLATESPLEVLDELLKRDKYLRLAHWMRKNRGDWNDGANYAANGLRGFYADSDMDHEIEADVSSYITEWDGDGRCFRDCKWNYDRIFGLVSPELFADYEKVAEFCA